MSPRSISKVSVRYTPTHMLVECHHTTARHKTCEASFVSSLGMSREIDVYVCTLIACEAYAIVITTAEVFDLVAL